MKLREKSWIALTIALLQLSLLPIIFKYFGSVSADLQLLFYSYIIAAVVSLAVCYIFDKKGMKSLFTSRKMLVVMAVAGLCNGAISQYLVAFGTVGTDPSIAAIVYRGWILIAALLTPIVLRNRVSIYQLCAIFAGFIGLYIVMSQGTLSLQHIASPAMLALLGSAFVFATAVLLVKRFNASTMASVALFNVVSLFFIMGLSALLKVSLFAPVTASFLGAALFLGIVNYGIGTTLYYYAFKHMGAILTSNLTMVVPFITILLSFALLGTPLEPYYFIAALILAGAVIAQQHFSSKAPEYIRSKSEGKRLQLFDVTSAFAASKELSDQISESNKALALRLSGTMQMPGTHDQLLDRYGCIMFTNRDPHANTENEIEFINQIMGAREDETILIGLGKPERVESAFDDMLSKRQEQPTIS